MRKLRKPRDRRVLSTEIRSARNYWSVSLVAKPPAPKLLRVFSVVDYDDDYGITADVNMDGHKTLLRIGIYDGELSKRGKFFLFTTKKAAQRFIKALPAFYSR